eukprot:3626255-Pleurochrysis_carterae.AAC.1
MRRGRRRVDLGRDAHGPAARRLRAPPPSRPRGCSAPWPARSRPLHSWPPRSSVSSGIDFLHARGWSHDTEKVAAK